MASVLIPRVYVASLSDYNAGILHGRWIDVGDLEGLREAVAAMLSESPTAKADGCPAEEWAIHDYEGFGPIKVSESEDLATVCQWAEAIDRHGEPFAAWVAREPAYHTDPEKFEEAYRGHWKSLEDYAAEFCAECMGEVPAWLAGYVDYEKMGADWEMGGDIYTVESDEGGVWVFDGHV